MFLLGLLIGVAIYAWWMAKDCFVVVDEGQVAVITRFGAAKKNADGSLKLHGPGFHFKWPFEDGKVVSLREQLIHLGGENGAAEPMMLSDGTVIRLQAMLRYAPQRDGIEKYLFGLHHRREHVAGLFSSLLRNEIANVKASPSKALERLEDDLENSFALVRRDRQLLNARIADFAKKEMRDYGVTFEAIDITDLHPPEELADALNAVMSARSEADSLRFRSQSDCAQKVLAAERGVDIAKARAGAVEAEIDELGRHLAQLEQGGVLDAYVDRRKAEVLSDARTVYLKDGGVR